jgi:DNA-directed RNA polymerase specialized sigma24 family protein
MNPVLASKTAAAPSASTISPAASRARIESLCRAHRASLVRFAAKRMPGRTFDAEDAVQDVFVDLLSGASTVPTDEVQALERLRALVKERITGSAA